MARLTTADLTTPAAPSAKEGQSPTPSFRPARPRRAFEEIIHQIKALIEAGALKPGDKLPSERALAAEFQVSRNTLREALRTLELGGQITVIVKEGEGHYPLAPKELDPVLEFISKSIPAKRRIRGA